MPDATPGSVVTVVGDKVNFLTRARDAVSNAYEGFIAGVTGSSWFGPGQPLPPLAPPGEQGRRFDYPFYVNTRVQPRSADPDAISYEQLESLSNAWGLLRLVIETRKDQIERIPYVFKLIQDPDEKTADFSARNKRDGRLKNIEKMFKKPDGERFFSSWVRGLLEDVFVYDAASIMPLRAKGKPVEYFDAIDGKTITRLVDLNGRTPRYPSVSYQQILKGMPSVNMTAGPRLAGDDRQDLIYVPRNIRNGKLYGFSPCEQIRWVTNLALRREFHQIAFYTQGNIPDSIISVPDTWTVQQIVETQAHLDNLAGDLEARRRFLVFPSTKVTFPKLTPLKDEMDEWLAKIVCYAFSVSAQPFLHTMSRASSKTASDTAESEGLIPLLNWLKQIFDYMIQEFLGFEDIEFAWMADEEPDKLKQAQIFQIYLTDFGQGPVMTPDEVREELGRDPLARSQQIDPETGALITTTATKPGAKPATPSSGNTAVPAASGTSAETNQGDTKVPEAEKALAIQNLKKKDFEPNRDDLVSGLAKMARRVIFDVSKPGPKTRKAEIKLAKLLEDEFGAQATVLGPQIVRDYREGKSAEEIMKAAEIEYDEDFLDEAADALDGAYTEAGIEAYGKLDISDEDLFDKLNTRALSFAGDRAAEMVGKKWVKGELVDNPNPKWAITDTTRDGLRRMVVGAYEDGHTPAQLARTIEDSYEFSRSRSKMIASTEMNRASSSGNMTAWRDSGVVQKKEWLLSADHPEEPDECDDNADQGLIPLDDSFSDGSDSPPAHPRCWCTASATVDSGDE